MKIEFSLNDALFTRAVQDVVQPTIRRAVRELQSRMQTKFQLPKGGRFYYRPKSVGGGRYRASAKGEAPAIRTVRLFASLIPSYPSPLEAQLKIDTPYAAFLEDRNKLDRPFVRPSIEETVAAMNGGGNLLSQL